MILRVVTVFLTLFGTNNAQFQTPKSEINYENLRRFMQQSPENLAKTLQLLENPYIATALVNSNKTPDFGSTSTEKPPSTTTPREESNKLLDFLLSQRQSDGPRYQVRKPPISLVPPSVNTRGILDDPLLGSFFQNTREDLPPLEVRFFDKSTKRVRF